jgi:hypothetical protein
MRALRAIPLAAALVVVLPAVGAVAQVSVDPSVTPELNTGGWIHGMAILFGLIGLVVILMLVAAYIRFAPRFSTDESTLRVVRADRVRPGEELPRRTVDIKGAAPVLVAPPPLPQPAGVAAAPAAAAPAAAPVSAPATAPAAAPAPAQAGPVAEAAPSTQAPQGAPASQAAPTEADGATDVQEAPAADASAPPPAERVEVSLDQEVFDQTLKELLEKGTDKRVAEGQARRAAMIAARKKAAGEA